MKLTYGDGSARYDGRTDPHNHARCLSCDQVFDVPGSLPDRDLDELRESVGGFSVTGFRLELLGYCSDCGTAAPPTDIAQA